MVPLTFSPYHGASGGGKGIKLAGQILVERQNVIVPVRRSPSTISKTLRETLASNKINRFEKRLLR